MKLWKNKYHDLTFYYHFNMHNNILQNENDRYDAKKIEKIKISVKNNHYYLEIMLKYNIQNFAF